MIGNKKDDSVIIQLRIHKKMKDALKEIAGKKFIKINDVIRSALADYIEKQSKELKN